MKPVDKQIEEILNEYELVPSEFHEKQFGKSNWKERRLARLSQLLTQQREEAVREFVDYLMIKVPDDVEIPLYYSDFIYRRLESFLAESDETTEERSKDEHIR